MPIHYRTKVWMRYIDGLSQTNNHKINQYYHSVLYVFGLNSINTLYGNNCCALFGAYLPNDIAIKIELETFLSDSLVYSIDME